jgi:hypothetical protein
MHKIKYKKHVTTLIGIEKDFDKIQHCFMRKALKNLGLEGTNPYTIYRSYKWQSSGQYHTKFRKLKVFILKSWMSLSTLIQYSTFYYESEQSDKIIK